MKNQAENGKTKEKKEADDSDVYYFSVNEKQYKLFNPVTKTWKAQE